MVSITRGLAAGVVVVTLRDNQIGIRKRDGITYLAVGT